jgi:hypothetical protein
MMFVPVLNWVSLLNGLDRIEQVVEFCATIDCMWSITGLMLVTLAADVGNACHRT